MVTFVVPVVYDEIMFIFHRSVWCDRGVGFGEYFRNKLFFIVNMFLKWDITIFKRQRFI